jgi:hypothetical protein
MDPVLGRLDDQQVDHVMSMMDHVSLMDNLDYWLDLVLLNPLGFRFGHEDPFREHLDRMVNVDHTPDLANHLMHLLHDGCLSSLLHVHRYRMGRERSLVREHRDPRCIEDHHATD